VLASAAAAADADVAAARANGPAVPTTGAAGSQRPLAASDALADRAYNETCAAIARFQWGREVTLDGIGRTIQVSVAARHVPPATGTPVPRVSAMAIPYHLWDNRGPGGMRLWIPGT